MFIFSRAYQSLLGENNRLHTFFVTITNLNLYIMDITDYIISALKWLIKWFFKLIWMGIKAIFGAAKEEASNKPSPSVTPASAASSSRVAK